MWMEMDTEKRESEGLSEMQKQEMAGTIKNRPWETRTPDTLIKSQVLCPSCSPKSYNQKRQKPLDLTYPPGVCFDGGITCLFSGGDTDVTTKILELYQKLNIKGGENREDRRGYQGVHVGL